MPQSQISKIAIPELNEKAILITGASTGIGAELARAFAGQGAGVGLHYNASRTAAETVAREIESAGGNVFLVQGDVSKTDIVMRIVEDTANHFGKLDGLINNAGLMLGRVSLDEIDDSQYDAVMDLNARSVLMATRAARPWLRKNGGFVINTTSIAARNGGAGGAMLYASSKAFVSTMTRGLAKELIGERIRVNAVAPGVINTPFHERYSTQEQLEAMEKTIPLGRLGEPEDCVGAYLFLASSSLSGYIIGQVIEVNGGQLMP